MFSSGHHAEVTFTKTVRCDHIYTLKYIKNSIVLLAGFKELEVRGSVTITSNSPCIRK